ncbi:nickel pincer cofactor biosynthesis protein LarC [Aneurinibacillus sp. Ricciae_BoGa-3]|uniref:nickel pincer cofactor biosynthesis protein LarC n=1 Tax=Aneurinibacillus sp. Ricciae_BoGa-3 TaxID=3022697 RepID=UPI0023422956|nr:nickel pincer cofactor biosynthesis protein LarC [Aneurinibacillus sp. Ricciae_BoGa-3]WCK54437.1 nickel pincer cofactor biosynthesis protein LarC [Aneurinibacillus sp. Ricciae_BoGa-3]
MPSLYLDCISGIAGDMALAALIDLGADPAYIIRHLRELPLDDFTFEIEEVNKLGITSKKLKLCFGQQQQTEHTHSGHHHDPDHHHEHNHHHHVESADEHTHHHEHREASAILHMIEHSNLPERVKDRSLAIFREIALAEGKIHGISTDEVHFHEVGAMDSIIDIIGVCLALESLDIEDIYASHVPTGSGFVRMAHGLYPIPAPATAQLLKGIPLAELNVKGELTTPTGAGILKALVKEFGTLGSATILHIGYGAGDKEFGHPNVLRALLVEKMPTAGTEGSIQAAGAKPGESLCILEAQVDDMTGEGFGYVMERLLDEGALDVYYTPVYMKKNRPGTLITVLASPEKAERFEDILLMETTTLGVRKIPCTRRILDRNLTYVDTPYGKVSVKQAILKGEVIRQIPEYEDVKKAAIRHGVPFYKVYTAALQF